MIRNYFQEINELLHTVEEKETETLKQAASKIAESIQSGGIIHFFGCGHSHMLAEEVFYRAGGLVPINPIFHEPLMLHENATESSALERKEGYAGGFMKDEDIRVNDVLVVISTSGRNSVPIDVVEFAKEKGAFVISISSKVYGEQQTSRHSSGKFLHEAADLAIDNHIPVGDALIKDERVAIKFAPGSSVVGIAIVNSMLAEAISQMAESGFEPPILLSGNVDGADEHNAALIEKYRGRIKLS
ncbi:SIS domain-containing protein [Ornithinibacillus contaminans]|uniref:SIS domain-containing protein n=1 Tax=Ornithinibacillus contaminans TaxID=694055 RepID=UPI00064DFC1D|nr:SIS domain-containing protein [Ornithinibacillus contaminans]